MKSNDWWKDAVVYQIYPKSFQDSNNDGIGDLKGILQHLDYIRELGADVIWLCPVYASPNADNGYDISNYQSIHPDFGTMEDFELLLSEIHRRNMKLIMDLVVNHTSDEHIWFQESRKSRENPYRDYYIWKEGKNRNVPNNWTSWFGGSAWEWDPNTEMYYLHIFHKKQPDLNWNNPMVRKEIYHMMQWWLDKGIDGFRMDVISLISKPEKMPDAPDGNLSPYCINGPHVHEFLKEMYREVLSKYSIMTVGECPGITVDEAKKYAGNESNELNMVFYFDHTGLTDGKYGKWTNKPTPLPELKAVFEKWQNGLKNASWNCLFWGNHDQPRAVSKFGCSLPEYRDLSAKMLCTCLYFMQGTPYIYQGEELGMPNAGFSDISQYRDVESINAYNNFVNGGVLPKRTMLEYLGFASRDNARTPMQWTDNAGCGFSNARPWIGFGPSWRAVNAERELNAPASVFHYYQKVLKIRKGNPIIKNGSFVLLCPEDENVFAYQREWMGHGYFIICNFTQDDQKTFIPDGINGKQILCNYENPTKLQHLRPYEAAVIAY